MDLLKVKYSVETTALGGNETVQSINGKQSDERHFWKYVVNGIEGTVPAGGYVTKDGDTIKWELQETNPSL